MALSATAYNYAKKLFLTADLDLETSAKVALLTDDYTPDIDAHQFWTDVSGSEVTGSGYTAGGADLANASATVDNTNDLAYVDADDSSWTSATMTDLRYAVIYRNTGDAATSPLVGYVNFGSNKSLTDGTFTLNFSTAGVVKIA